MHRYVERWVLILVLWSSLLVGYACWRVFCFYVPTPATSYPGAFPFVGDWAVCGRLELRGNVPGEPP